MYIDPTVYQGRPSDDRIPQELAVYDKLEELGISFTRVDHDHADTMEDCLLIERTLGARICKNLFLCNRQQTDMERLLRTIPGSVSALELMFDTQALVRLVIDRDLLKDRYLSGHPGISTSTLCLEREEMIRFVEATGHTPTYLDLPDPRLSEQGGGLVTKS